jgi:hypothetical protein
MLEKLKDKLVCEQSFTCIKDKAEIQDNRRQFN